MSWSAYRLVYQAKSPIHIGWHTLGYINLTRYYIPGRTMWGAFTANLTRTYGEPGVGDYDTFGTLLKTDVLVSYFYPALNPDRPMMPRFADGGLSYGDMCAHDFERSFIKSFGQTAILPESNTAEDQSLHESEFIAPMVEDEVKGQRRVYFVGYVFIKEGAAIFSSGINKAVGWDGSAASLKNAVSEVFVGGDRKYGWGRLVLDDNRTEANPAKFFMGTKLGTEGTVPSGTVPQGTPIPAHLPVDTGLALKGDIEPLVSREWSNEGPGQTIRAFSNNLYWMPGSILEETDSRRRTFAIGPYGILTLEDNNVSKPS